MFPFPVFYSFIRKDVFHCMQASPHNYEIKTQTCNTFQSYITYLKKKKRLSTLGTKYGRMWVSVALCHTYTHTHTYIHTYIHTWIWASYHVTSVKSECLLHSIRYAQMKDKFLSFCCSNNIVHEGWRDTPMVRLFISYFTNTLSIMVFWIWQNGRICVSQLIFEVKCDISLLYLLIPVNLVSFWHNSSCHC